MLFEVLKYDVLRDGAAGRRKVPPVPEPLPPVALSDPWELLLDFPRRPALHLPYQIADCQLWRNGHEHMDVITRQDALDDLDAIFGTNLTDDLPDAQPKIASKHLEAVFR